jgi:leader peptidase (prepilin peptidase)/N-methyltransferase
VIDLPPLDWCCRPGVLGLLGLLIGSFLNVVVHRLPLMLERQWWADVAGQLPTATSFAAPSRRSPTGCARAGRQAALRAR